MKRIGRLEKEAVYTLILFRGTNRKREKERKEETEREREREKKRLCVRVCVSWGLTVGTGLARALDRQSPNSRHIGRLQSLFPHRIHLCDRSLNACCCSCSTLANTLPHSLNGRWLLRSLTPTSATPKQRKEIAVHFVAGLTFSPPTNDRTSIG